MIPDGLAAHINLGSWPVLPIFDVLEKAGEIDHMEMFNIFNMGIGMVLAVNAEDADKTMELLKSNGEAVMCSAISSRRPIATSNCSKYIYGGEP